MGAYRKPPRTSFMDEIDVDVVREGRRYCVTIHHAPTGLQVRKEAVRQCRLYSSRELLITELREKVRRRLGRVAP